MIGPTSSFYDPNTDPQNLDAQVQQYEQWMNQYQNHPQQNQYTFGNAMSFDFYPPPESDTTTTGYRDHHQLPSLQYHQTQYPIQQQQSAIQEPPTWLQQNELYPQQQQQPPSGDHIQRENPVSRPAPVAARKTAARAASKASAAPPPSAPKPAAAASKPSAKRKRPKPSQAERASESDSEDDDSYYLDGGISVGMAGFGVVNSRGNKATRLPGACTHCKKLKMKCDFPEGDNTCKRCKSGGHPCIVEGRKPRIAPNKREYLLAQIRQKDAIIESLLKQLHNPYLATPLSIASYRMATSPSDQGNKNIIAWLDRLQASVRESGAGMSAQSGPSSHPFKLDKDDVASTSLSFDANTSTSRSSTRSPKPNGTRMTHAQKYGLAPIPVTTDEDGDSTIGSQGGSTGDDDADDEFQNALPDSHVPLGLIANLSLSNNSKLKAAKAAGKEGHHHGQDGAAAAAASLLDDESLDDDNVGVASETYFMPGPATDLDIRAMLIEQHSPPEILVHGLVTPDDVDKLFEIFYQRVNPFMSILDPVLHTPALTFARCPFLFTVICAISSRYYTEKSEIYPIAMHFAKHSAANALIDGWKSVELCQAYILMSTYAVPAKKWEEDRSWLYTGLAIRIATDLNLHQVTVGKNQTEKQERETLNKIRVWMVCFNLDRSTATQFGKPSTIKDDYISRHSKEWYKKSQYNIPFDVHMCGHTALLRLVGKFHEEIFSDPTSPTGLNKQADFRGVTLHYDEQLSRFKAEWTVRFKEWGDRFSEDGTGSANLRRLLLPFLVEYSRLVMFSFGFQQSFQNGMDSGDNIFFTKCLESAKAVIRCMVDDLAPTGYMCYAPDGHFVFASFASAFLLKLLRPEFSHLLDREEENEVFDLIGRLIQTLSSSNIAIDDRHTPKLYARFLAGLISRHRRDGATAGRLQTQPPHPPHPLPPIQNDYSQGSGSGSYSMSQGTSGGGGGSYMSHGYGGSFGDRLLDTPIYRPEATYTAGAGPIQFSGDLDMLNFDNAAMSGDGMLATMQALKNPAWWQNMMMPGFSWPEPVSSPGSNTSSSPSSGYTGASAASFGIFHASQPVAPH